MMKSKVYRLAIVMHNGERMPKTEWRRPVETNMLSMMKDEMNRAINSADRWEKYVDVCRQIVDLEQDLKSRATARIKEWDMIHSSWLDTLQNDRGIVKKLMEAYDHRDLLSNAKEVVIEARNIEL